MKKYVTLSVAAIAFVASHAQAAPNANLERCISAALKEKPGTVVKLEHEIDNKVAYYELDIDSPDGKVWSVECDANTGKVTKVEEELADPELALFKEKAKVSEVDARKTALAAFPGEVTEFEYDVDSNGSASYEYDIKTAKGEVKVEVDAVSGKVTKHRRDLF